MKSLESSPSQFPSHDQKLYLQFMSVIQTINTYILINCSKPWLGLDISPLANTFSDPVQDNIH